MIYVVLIIISLWYQNIFRKCYKHQAFIASNKRGLSSQCELGKINQEVCHHQYLHTVELPVGAISWIICYLTPVLKCVIHGVTSYLFGYKQYNQREKKGNLYLNDDVLVNALPFWTLYGFDTKISKQNQNKFKTRYHVTDEWLENFCDSVIFGGNHVNVFLNDIKSRYLVTARSHYRKIGVPDQQLSKLFMKKQAKLLYNDQTIKKVVSMIAFGYIDPVNSKINSIINKSFQYITCGDSSHSIMQILGKQQGMNYIFVLVCLSLSCNKYIYMCCTGNNRKIVLKTSGFRIMNRLAYKVGDTRFLEKGGEDYLVIFDTMTDFLADNYENAEHHEVPASFYKHKSDSDDKMDVETKADQDSDNKMDVDELETKTEQDVSFKHYHMISLDFATNCNPDIIRNIFVHLLKFKLNNPQESISWINEKLQFEYRWDKYFLIICQEIIHIYIRFRKAKCFNMQHADALWIMKNVRNIIKAIRNPFDINKSPPVVGHASGIYTGQIQTKSPKYDPYTLIDNTPKQLFQNKEYFAIMKHVVRTHCQLKSTRDKKLISELIKEKYKYSNVISVDAIREELIYCVQNSAPQFQLLWTSIFDVDIDLWRNVRYTEYVYSTHDDKKDPSQIPEEIQVPYFKYGITQYIQLLSLLRLQFSDYPAFISPFSSCISLASYFDSIFVYVYIYIYMSAFVCLCLILFVEYKQITSRL